MFGAWRRQRVLEHLARASAWIADAPLDEALDELDGVDVRQLEPADVALWLNNRAYVLAQMGKATEALEHLEEAEALLPGPSDAGSTVVRDEILVSCIIGTRGIAHLHAGALDEAECHLLDAFARGEPDLASPDAAVAYQGRTLASERLWWLAEIAERRGDHVQRLQLLQRAAQFEDTRFGEKARAALESS